MEDVCIVFLFSRDVRSSARFSAVCIVLCINICCNVDGFQQVYVYIWVVLYLDDEGEVRFLPYGGISMMYHNSICR